MTLPPELMSIIMDYVHGCPQNNSRKMLLELNFIMRHFTKTVEAKNRLQDFYGRPHGNESPFAGYALAWIKEPDEPEQYGNSIGYGSWK